MKRIAWPKVGIVALVLVACLAAGYLAFTMRAANDGSTSDTPNLYATIGPEEITQEEISRAYAQRDDLHANLSLDEYFEEVYVPRTLLIVEARSMGLVVPDDEVESWVFTINRTLASRNVTFETYLDDLNVTRDELRSDIESTMLLDQMLAVSVASKVNVSAAEIEAAYESEGYEELGIPLEQARYEIGPRILREKQDEKLRELIANLSEKYDVTRV